MANNWQMAFLVSLTILPRQGCDGMDDKTGSTPRLECSYGSVDFRPVVTYPRLFLPLSPLQTGACVLYSGGMRFSTTSNPVRFPWPLPLGIVSHQSYRYLPGFAGDPMNSVLAVWIIAPLNVAPGPSRFKGDIAGLDGIAVNETWLTTSWRLSDSPQPAKASVSGHTESSGLLS